jgi:hypothetical protein
MTSQPKTLAIQILLALTALTLSAVPSAGAAENDIVAGQIPSVALGAVSGPPVNIEPPVLARGLPFVAGSTVEVHTGKWEGDPLTLVIQWLRCSTKEDGGETSCIPITKAVPPPDSLLYFVTPSELSAQIAVEVTATNAFDSTSVRTPLSSPVVAPTAELATHPPRRTSNKHASFVFSSNARNYKLEDEEVGIRFKCKLDQKPFARCRSPFEANLKPGRHVFEVKAVGPGRARDEGGDRFSWRILRGRDEEGKRHRGTGKGARNCCAGLSPTAAIAESRFRAIHIPPFKYSAISDIRPSGLRVRKSAPLSSMPVPRSTFSAAMA